MRRIIRLLAPLTFTVAGCLPGLLGSSSAAAASHSALADLAYVHTMLDSTALGTFAELSAGHTGDAWFDWNTDLCSAPLVGSTGLTFDFRSSCRRHDFGYRNLTRIDRRYGTRVWNATNRAWVDSRFLADMRRQCSTRSLWQRPTCYGWAQTFYAVVRLVGGP